jgi:hypothetical protein
LRAWADLDRVGHRLVVGEVSVLLEAALQRAALDVLEDDVGPAVVLAGVDHPDQVGVREARRRSRLAAEALELILLVGDLPVQQLDGDLAVEDLVEREVDRRHPA